MFNIMSYIIFLAVSFYITIHVGKRCYQEGKFYLEYLIHDSNLCVTINRILLGCFYLINLGYISISLTSWERILSLEQVVAVTAIRIGNIMLILCVLHYVNIFTLYFLRNNLNLK